MVAVAPPKPALIEYLCPVCKPNHRNVLVKATEGSVVEAYCRHCKYRQVIVVSLVDRCESAPEIASDIPTDWAGIGSELDEVTTYAIR